MTVFYILCWTIDFILFYFTPRDGLICLFYLSCSYMVRSSLFKKKKKGFLDFYHQTFRKRASLLIALVFSPPNHSLSSFVFTVLK